MTETLNVDEAIRVVVAPSQASYFAGEPFSVTVTFTNTRTPDAVTPRSASHTHKRSAHSISSVPLARPPTSPGMLRTALPAVPTRNTESNVALTRKGLIGKGRTLHGLGVTPGVVAVPGRKPLVKSLSISITSHELEGDSGKGKSPLNPFRTNGIRAACKFAIVYYIVCSTCISSVFTPHTVAACAVDIVPYCTLSSTCAQAVSTGWSDSGSGCQACPQSLATVSL
ncbi:hypothetical protein EVJ58_g5609 [Rhodofomes roseus]|uniref:Uncharacterized protein n=1 Tax=Rhodofomes roseus TaxID=34475 RepID=A0A4Y9YE22_9APHY|nr:hypothetical protein EVJ58_g5609 [Rhodofomes roseus]